MVRLGVGSGVGSGVGLGAGSGVRRGVGFSVQNTVLQTNKKQAVYFKDDKIYHSDVLWF